MNILICDDMPNEAAKLSGLLEGLGYKPAVFTGGADALAYVRAGAPVDVCILDIVMEEMGGIELARLLREDGFCGEIVFLSVSDRYGPQTYGVKAFYYLLKPTTAESVGRVLDEISAAREKADTGGIALKAYGTARVIPFREIAVAEVVRNHVIFRLETGESVQVRAVFSEIAPKLLCDGRFIQCHRSYIVNMDAIASMTSREAVTRRGVRVPVSKSYSDVKIRYMNRGLRGELK